MSNQQPSFASDLVDKTAEFGLWKTKILFWGAIAVAICLVLSGIKLYFTNQSNLIDVTGKIVKINNVTTNKEQRKNTTVTHYTYELTVSYPVTDNGEENTLTAKIIHNTTSPVLEDGSIELTYDKDKPEKVSTKVIRNKTIALILSVVGAVILLITGINYWLSKSFKIYAAAEGASTIAGVISAPFRN